MKVKFYPALNNLHLVGYAPCSDTIRIDFKGFEIQLDFHPIAMWVPIQYCYCHLEKSVEWQKKLADWLVVNLPFVLIQVMLVKQPIAESFVVELNQKCTDWGEPVSVRFQVCPRCKEHNARTNIYEWIWEHEGDFSCQNCGAKFVLGEKRSDGSYNVIAISAAATDG
jgi:hypothetical protein